LSARVQVKICCIGSPAEAQLALHAGASALGLVSEMPSGAGMIPEEAIAEIALGLPPGVSSFLLTSKTDPEEIIEQQRRCGVNTLQLVDALPDGAHATLREALPGIALVQVIHVLGEASIEEARRFDGQVDALLLDSGNPNLKIKELGGTGRVHDWSLSARIVAETRTKVYLAGGLRPDNVAEAIAKVRPYGVDLCTGVRRDAELDPEKLHAFMRAVAGAGA
jgi:phosphoribosylanthranilate isomerase